MAQKITKVIMDLSCKIFIIPKVMTGTLLMALQEVKGQRDQFLGTTNVCAKFDGNITKTILKPLSCCQSQILKITFFCYFSYIFVFYRIKFRRIILN